MSSLINDNIQPQSDQWSRIPSNTAESGMQMAGYPNNAPMPAPFNIMAMKKPTWGDYYVNQFLPLTQSSANTGSYKEREAPLLQNIDRLRGIATDVGPIESSSYAPYLRQAEQLKGLGANEQMLSQVLGSQAQGFGGVGGGSMEGLINNTSSNFVNAASQARGNELTGKLGIAGQDIDAQRAFQQKQMFAMPGQSLGVLNAWSNLQTQQDQMRQKGKLLAGELGVIQYARDNENWARIKEAIASSANSSYIPGAAAGTYGGGPAKSWGVGGVTGGNPPIFS